MSTCRSPIHGYLCIVQEKRSSHSRDARSTPSLYYRSLRGMSNDAGKRPLDHFSPERIMDTKFVVLWEANLCTVMVYGPHKILTDVAMSDVPKIMLVVVGSDILTNASTEDGAPGLWHRLNFFFQKEERSRMWVITWKKSFSEEWTIASGSKFQSSLYPWENTVEQN